MTRSYDQVVTELLCLGFGRHDVIPERVHGRKHWAARAWYSGHEERSCPHVEGEPCDTPQGAVDAMVLKCREVVGKGLGK